MRHAKIGEWDDKTGWTGSISVVTNSEDISKDISEVGDIIKMRHERGDDGEHRYSREGEKAIIRGLLSSLRGDGRMGGAGMTMAIDAHKWSGEFYDNISGSNLSW